MAGWIHFIGSLNERFFPDLQKANTRLKCSAGRQSRNASRVSSFTPLINDYRTGWRPWFAASRLVVRQPRPKPESNPAINPTDEQQIIALLGRMTECWNAHDIDGYMDVFWRSPDLCYVCNGQEVMGWGEPDG
jgi:hypothetical protein